MNKATKKANWYKAILWEIGFPCEKPLTIFCDNHTDIKITKNPIIHARTKHLEGNCHYIRDQVKKNRVDLTFVRSKEQNVDASLFSIPFNNPQRMALQFVMR